MNKNEKVLFVKALTNAIAVRMINDIESGKIPENWEGPEIRALLAERSSDARYIGRLTGKRLRDYHNDILVNGL